MKNVNGVLRTNYVTFRGDETDHILPLVIGRTGESPKPKSVSGMNPDGSLQSTDWSRFRCAHSSQAYIKGTDTRVPPTYVKYDFWDSAWSMRGTWHPIGFTGKAYPPRYYSELTTKALLSLLSDQYDISPTLAESVETANYLAARTRDLFSVLGVVKRGKLTSAAKKVLREFGHSKEPVGNSIASRYLEYKYAIRPLASDVASYLELSREGLDTKMRIIGKSSKVSDRSGESRFKISNLSHYPEVLFKYDVADKEFCKLFYEVSDLEQRAASLLGIADIQNSILKGAWELVPYSFVVDWGVGVGDYLQALTADAGLTFRSGYISRKVEFTGSGHPGADGWSRDRRYHYPLTDLSHSASEESYSRSVIHTSPSPSVVVSSPFSTGNVLSAIALISQFRK